MYRHLLVIVAAVGLALPGIASVSAVVSRATASPPESTPPAAPSAALTLTPAASPSPDDVTPPVTVAKGVSSRWRSDTSTIRLRATDDASGVAATVYRVDSGTWRFGDEVQVRAPKDHSNDGEHVLEYYSVDNALNTEVPKTVTVKIDTRPPRFVWKSITPGVIDRVEPLSCKFTIDEHTGSVALSYRITDQYGYAGARRSGIGRDAGTCTVQVTPRYRDGRGFVPGVYRIQFTLRDEAGNETVSELRSFRNSRPMTGGVWRRVSGAGRVVALTFDDGGVGPWSSMLDTLRRHKMHATFFPLGAAAAASPSLMRRSVQEGHAIGSHGWTHSMMSRQSVAEIQAEWLRSIAPWWSVTGYSPMPYCRPPYGDMDSSTTSASAALGFYRVILWDVDPRDWSDPGAGVITSRVLSRVRPGSIVCMHLRGQTATALPAILKGLKARGYRCVSLPELFHAAGMR